ncbi:MAG: hypothetical protein P4L51_24640 [Puia sp.]|nr:hypothetical protein [Puia sp.]
MIFKKDNLKFGAALGLIAPVISLVIYYFVKFFPLYSLKDFLFFLQTNKTQVTALSVPCLVLNIALFTYYINSQRDKTAKGIFAATLVYAIAAILFKYV